MKHFLLSGVIAWVVGTTLVQPVLAQTTERVPALREKVYSQLARAQQEAEDNGVQAGLAALKSVEDRADSMNSYERAMLWNFYGYTYYDNEQVDKAIDYFAKVVQESLIPESLRKNTLFSLAQLSLTEGNFQETLDYLDRWENVAKADELSKAWVLKAQALYQAERYAESLPFIQKAIAAADKEDKAPQENWLILARAIHYELKQTEQVAAVLERLVKLYSKPEYWLQLAGVYGQLDQTKKQLAVLEAANQQGFIDTAGELRNLAQVYYINQLPYKAAKIMKDGFDANKIETNLANRKFYAQSLMQAREYQQALDAYLWADEVSEDGEMLAQAAHVALNLDKNQRATALAKQALEKGEVRNAGNLWLLQGMAAVNQRQYEQAVEAFAKALEFPESKAAAQQWQRYAKSQVDYQARVNETAMN
ncbi:hypothetical protein [Idiomarina baltica]|uniref:tetratricopeptide repeat protein n=1 Tax=Idiomarina baltica TaxID=190892 RepID=UPI0023554C7D|nr:hypothetical protein [Idiomarina baltica]